MYGTAHCNNLELAGTRKHVAAAGPRQPTRKVSHQRYKMYTCTCTLYIYMTAHDVTTHQHKSSNGNRPRVTLVVDLSGRIRHGRGPNIPHTHWQIAGFF